MADPKPTKILVLHIEVPGVWADDLDASAAEWADDQDNPTPKDYLNAVLEEWMRPEVGLTVVTLPGEKSSNNDFDVHAYTGWIVGAETRDHHG
jgi:hypothetical protein